ncbi:SusC/RagA family TonB-linked outer membrane protein [Chryseobacterium sp. FH1]|uniref:SusC/RagA family TonB-linked outer membrane protein n=1 Tax=Chryseobacterium sp. FH1 TaxID=1233951 RepID=UPI00068ECCBA|nr:SusC/RagA family TonB-linked outer membrane protein [Chryseobacterium sp. FH1]
MNVKLPVLTVGVLFFCGQALMGQKTKTVTKPKTDTVSEKIIEEVVVQGYRTVSKKTSAVSSATITNETIENRPNANVLNTMQGQLAGVNIIAGSGQPGAKPEIIIRGVGTINGNFDPLYVIDGFPSNSDNFRTLNPNDIESMDVLKDAAALAEYGSRGSNGVVVIRTKRGGFNSPLSIRYSNQLGVSILQKAKYDLASTSELLTLQKRFGVGLGLTLTDDEIQNYPIQTDWLNYFFKPALTNSHNINFESGSKNLSSFTSLGYFDQEGILRSTGLKRFTLRNNLNGKNESGKIRYSVSTAIGHSKNNLATNIGTGGVNQNYVVGAFKAAPYISPSMYQNSQQLFDLAGGSFLYTPLYLMDKLKTFNNLTEETRIDVATDLSYKLTSELTARVKASGQLLHTRTATAQNPYSWNEIYFAPQNNYQGFEQITTRREFLFNNLLSLSYRKVLGDHTFEVAANSEFNHSTVQSTGFRQNGLNPLTYVFDTGAGYIPNPGGANYIPQTVSNLRLKLNMISYFGSFDYNFQKRFGVTGTVRTDGTNRFFKGYQWGTFWSAGGYWNLEEENFIKNLDFVNILKLRGSYGTTGNQRYIDGTIYAGLNPPGYQDTYTIGYNAYNAGTLYNNVAYSGQGLDIAFGYLPLTWETTRSYNIGLDFELFNKRLRGTFDRYERRTTNLFYDDPVSPTLGALSINKNTDIVVRNEGYELNLGYDIVKSQDWLFTIRANGALNNQRVLEVGTPYESPDGTLIINSNHLMYEFFVYKYLGVNPATGNMWFEDINGNPTETPKLEDRRYTGKNFYPKYQGGFGFDLNYKGFFMSTTFTYVAGVSRFDLDMDGYYTPAGNINNFNVVSDLLNAWTPTNTNTNVPSLTANNYAAADFSDRFLVDASYVRLRNFQLGYRVPSSLLTNTFVKDLSITLQGENLVTFSKWKGFDPESNRNLDVYQYPTPRIITLGFDVKF